MNSPIQGAGNPASIDAVLQQMRTLRAEAGLDVAQEVGKDFGVQRTAEPSQFQEMLSRALNNINSTQLESGRLSDGFVRGEHQDLVAVMVASQKASVSFQALNQVRNRVVTAYQDVMNMPI